MKKTMKIRNIKQLNAEKKLLKQRQAELEKAMKYDWKDVKDSLAPARLASDAFSSIMSDKDKSEEKGFVSRVLTGLAEKFAREMTEKAETRFRDWLKKEPGKE